MGWITSRGAAPRPAGAVWIGGLLARLLPGTAARGDRSGEAAGRPAPQRVRYLALQKTGSTYIVGFLDRHLGYDHARFGGQHAPAKGRKDRATFYFISIREPVALYSSLYRYGLGQKGALFLSMRRRGLAGLYDGTAASFERWLSMLLDERELTRVVGTIDPAHAALYGLQTARFLRLAVRRPSRTLARLDSREAVWEAYRRHGLADATVRVETLAEDLGRLIEGPLAGLVLDPEAARRELAEGTPRNAAVFDGLEPLSPSPELLARIEEREWFFHDELGYPRGGAR